MKCDDCIHLKCEKGDRWIPTMYECELDHDEEDCEDYSYYDYQDELDADYDRKLKWEEVGKDK